MGRTHPNVMWDPNSEWESRLGARQEGEFKWSAELGKGGGEAREGEQEVGSGGQEGWSAWYGTGTWSSSDPHPFLTFTRLTNSFPFYILSDVFTVYVH